MIHTVVYCIIHPTYSLETSHFLWQGKEPMEAEPSAHTKTCDDFTDSFKQWVAYGEALCHWSSLNFPFPTRTYFTFTFYFTNLWSCHLWTFGYYGASMENGLLERDSQCHVLKLQWWPTVKKGNTTKRRANNKIAEKFEFAV